MIRRAASMSAPSYSLLFPFRSFALALLLAAGASQAANRDIYLYQGPDRAERLVAQAKKEGTLVLYSTMTLEDATPLLAAFEKKYAIKVSMWRAVNQKLVQRTLAEARAGKLAADAFEGSGPGLEILIVLTLYNQAVDKLKEKGAPIDWKPLAPAFGRADGIALARQAQHPHAALLFADFVLSPEGQRLIKERARVPVNRKVDSTFDQSAFGIIDLAALLKEWDTWEGRWQALFLRERK